jgi:hypothetical protein
MLEMEYESVSWTEDRKIEIKLDGVVVYINAESKVVESESKPMKERIEAFIKRTEMSLFPLKL